VPVPLGTIRFRLQPLLGKAAIVEPGEGIVHCQMMKFLGTHLQPDHRFHAFRELPAQPLDQDLLVDGIQVEQQHQTHQTAHGQVELLLEHTVFFDQGWIGERDNAGGQQQHHRDGGPPQPPVAPLQPTQLGLDFRHTPARCDSSRHAKCQFLSGPVPARACTVFCYRVFRFGVALFHCFRMAMRAFLEQVPVRMRSKRAKRTIWPSQELRLMAST
jgi:hypothetical protein